MPPKGRKGTQGSVKAVGAGGGGRGRKGKGKSHVGEVEGVDGVGVGDGGNDGGKAELAEQSEEFEEEKEEEELAKSTADEDAQAAIISINLLDITNPIRPLNFGRWNDRKMVESKAAALHAEMKATSFSTTKYENMIPIIMKKEYLAESCINTNIKNTKLAPKLVLSEKGEEMREIYAAGGRHRRQAARIEVTALTDKIEAAREKMGDGTDGMGLEERIRELENQRQAVSEWGVIIYDEGK